MCKSTTFLAAFLILCQPGVVWSLDTEVETALRAMSVEFNKSLPLQIDREKTLEMTLVIQTTLLIKYKFTDETVISNPRFDSSRYVDHLRASLGESICKDSANYELFRNGARYNYVFFNRRGLKVIDFTLDEPFCTEYRRGIAPSKVP